MTNLKSAVSKMLPFADRLIAVLLYPSAWLMKSVRRAGVQRLPACKRVLMRLGVFPVTKHFYEPLFDWSGLPLPNNHERQMLALDFNEAEQISLLKRIGEFTSELRDIPRVKRSDTEYHLNNGTYQGGDADFLYGMIREKKPRRIVEIGSGNSTLMAIKATRRNAAEGYPCDHVCIEPYMAPWLEKTGVRVIRDRVEAADMGLFTQLEENDLLFIDSSHMIKPQGDVLFEYFEILPQLAKGVIVHVHDFFAPRDYPSYFVPEYVMFWNEQYLVEAFLSFNHEWKMLAALNYLYYRHNDSFLGSCPLAGAGIDPSALYIQRVGLDGL